jgi:hypothetical protein
MFLRETQCDAGGQHRSFPCAGSARFSAPHPGPARARREHIPEDGELYLLLDLVSQTADTTTQNVRHLFFTENGKLQGMMSKTDIAALLAKDVPFVGMLANTTRSKEAYVS